MITTGWCLVCMGCSASGRNILVQQVSKSFFFCVRRQFTVEAATARSGSNVQSVRSEVGNVIRHDIQKIRLAGSDRLTMN